MLHLYNVPFQVDECDDGALGRQLGGREQGADELVDLAVLRVVLVVVVRHAVLLPETDKDIKT